MKTIRIEETEYDKDRPRGYDGIVIKVKISPHDWWSKITWWNKMNITPGCRITDLVQIGNMIICHVDLQAIIPNNLIDNHKIKWIPINTAITAVQDLITGQIEVKTNSQIIIDELIRKAEIIKENLL